MHPIIQTVWLALGTAAAVVTLPGTIELLTLSIAALVPVRRRHHKTSSAPWRVAVVIPAHNEEKIIGSCVESLQTAARSDMSVDIYVIADNCTDKTAESATLLGARVLERSSESERGKGYALDFAFTTLTAHGYDCYLVVDADTTVASNFITEAAGAMRDGAAAVQARYLVSNLEESARTRMMGLALRAFNVVRPLGRDHLRLSAGILGNGFGLSSSTLKAVPYLASSVVEDLEYHLSLVHSGRRVTFINESTVYGEMPVRGEGVKTQRSRWEGGRLRMLVEKSPQLAAIVLRGELRMLEPLLELLLLPLAFHVVLLAIALSAPLAALRYVGAFGFVVVLAHLVAAILVGGGSWKDAITLLAAPFYILWKLMLIPSLLKNARSNHTWVRTNRNAELIPSARNKDGDIEER